MSINVRKKSREKQTSLMSSFAVEGMRVLATGLLTGVGVKLGSSLVERSLGSSQKVRLDSPKLMKASR